MNSHELSDPTIDFAVAHCGDPGARARRTALLCFERRRSRLTADLRHPLMRPRLPRKRYEDLQLAAALSRVESRCLARPGQAPAPVDDALFAGARPANRFSGAVARPTGEVALVGLAAARRGGGRAAVP